MMNIEWAEELSVGNEVIDSEHKKLMELASDIAYAGQAMDSLVLLRAIKRFRSCINCHFINEEQFAQVLNFPFSMHKVAHQNMLAELSLTTRELENGMEITQVFAERYAQFLRDWLIKHIAEDDMQMKPALQSGSYDSRPA